MAGSARRTIVPVPPALGAEPRHGALLAVRVWALGWWRLIDFGARLGVVALSPSSWRRERRLRMLRSLYAATQPLLPGFTLLSALVALVVIRIVLATSLSYGLSRYALDVLIRTLVLELIPLSAALFVAVRYSLAAGDAVRRLVAAGGAEPLRDGALPRALAGVFAVATLALASGAVTLLLAYLSAYGFAVWGFDAFTRTVGQVVDPVTALIFGLKTLSFGLAVAIVPMVATPRDAVTQAADGRVHGDLTRLARLLALVLLIEVAGLVGNYY